jgi:hypothetical protein
MPRLATLATVLLAAAGTRQPSWPTSPAHPPRRSPRAAPRTPRLGSTSAPTTCSADARNNPNPVSTHFSSRFSSKKRHGKCLFYLKKTARNRAKNGQYQRYTSSSALPWRAYHTRARTRIQIVRKNPLPPSGVGPPHPHSPAGHIWGDRGTTHSMPVDTRRVPARAGPTPRIRGFFCPSLARPGPFLSHSSVVSQPELIRGMEGRHRLSLNVCNGCRLCQNVVA